MPSIRAALVLLGGLLAACSSDTATGNGNGQVTAALADNPGSALSGSAAASTYSGTLTGSATVEISTDGTTWVSLGSATQVNLALQSAGSSSLYAGVSVPAATYSHVRLTLTGGHASLLGGSMVGALTLAGDAVIMVGGSDDQVVIEKTVTPFSVAANAAATVTVDLNTESWITTQVVTDLVAPDDAVAGSASVAVVMN